MAIYSDNGSETMPVSLLGQTSPQPWATAGWYTAPLIAPVPITNGNFYWLVVWLNGSLSIFFTGLMPPVEGTANWAIGAFPTNASTDPNLVLIAGLNENYCLYASGCPAIPPTPTFTPLPTASPTDTWTPVPTPTGTIITPTPTNTPSLTPTNSPTNTPTPTPT